MVTFVTVDSELPRVRRSLLRRVVERTRGYRWGVPRGVCRVKWGGIYRRDLPVGESRSIHCGRWSRIVAVYRGWSGSNGAVWDPS